MDLRFDSGFPKAVSYERLLPSLTEWQAVEKIMEDEFGGLRNLDWKLIKRQEDSTHIHLTYDLFYQDHPVFFQHLKIHFNKLGYVDYLTSTLQRTIDVPMLPSRSSWEEQKETALAILFGRQTFSGFSKGRLGIWLDENQEWAEWAFEVEGVPEGSEMLKRGVVSIEKARLLEEKQVMRHWGDRAEVNLLVFTPYPQDLTGGKDETVQKFFSETANTLKNDYCHVRYDSSDNGQHFDVGSTANLAYDPRGADYQRNCPGNCPNQKVDSGNVFYHVTEFRNWLNSRALVLGSTLKFPYDPLPVFVNFMAKKLNQKCPNGTTLSKSKQSNNAAYIGGPCDDSGSVDHCLVFLRYGDDAPCYTNAKDEPGGSIPRESLIVAHEYQHYVTDMLTGIEFGGANQIRVGDVIHEGYSDYFGASYSNVDIVGKYAFSTGFKDSQRDLKSTKSFDQSALYESPHEPGLVWASSLWELRNLLGSVKVDLLALKSLFYLSTNPGFIDSVEALVQADKSLNGGANETRIRTLFFDERKFLGSLTGAFQDDEKKIVKLGFQGCANVENTQSDSAFPAVTVFLIWLASTLWFGKHLWRKM